MKTPIVVLIGRGVALGLAVVFIFMLGMATGIVVMT